MGYSGFCAFAALFTSGAPQVNYSQSLTPICALYLHQATTTADCDNELEIIFQSFDVNSQEDKNACRKEYKAKRDATKVAPFDSVVM